jgi:hypothetical protein
MSEDTPTSSKIIDLMNTRGSKDTLVKILSEDKDVRRMSYWYLGGLITVLLFLFINPYTSLIILLLISTNIALMLTVLTGKLRTMLAILNNIKDESEVINYNKGLTDAINLLFHNNADLREKGKDIIFKEFPEHSEIILSSERILVDSLEDEYEDYVPHLKISDRIN